MGGKSKREGICVYMWLVLLHLWLGMMYWCKPSGWGKEGGATENEKNPSAFQGFQFGILEEGRSEGGSYEGSCFDVKKGVSLVLNVVSFETHPSGFHLQAVWDPDRELGRDKDSGEDAMELKDEAVLNKLCKVQRIDHSGKYQRVKAERWGAVEIKKGGRKWYWRRGIFG